MTDLRTMLEKAGSKIRIQRKGTHTYVRVDLAEQVVREWLESDEALTLVSDRLDEPVASEPDADAVERAVWEGVRAMFESRHGVGTCPDDRLEDLKAANKIGETWEEYLIACRAALSAMRPAIDREKLEEIREDFAGMSDAHRNGYLDGDHAEDLYGLCSSLLAMIGGPDGE